MAAARQATRRSSAPAAAPSALPPSAAPFDSRAYWDRRYRTKGNSGAGSYGRLAAFKAEIINQLIAELSPGSLIDYGVGDGNQLELLNLEGVEYTGIDVSPTVIAACKTRFKHAPFRFLLDTEAIRSHSPSPTADLVMSCDVIYHLVEDPVYERYMSNLFGMARNHVLIYAYDTDHRHAAHVRYRKFTEYIAERFPEWTLVRHVPQRYPQRSLGTSNHDTSASDFYLYTRKG